MNAHYNYTQEKNPKVRALTTNRCSSTTEFFVDWLKRFGITMILFGLPSKEHTNL